MTKMRIDFKLIQSLRCFPNSCPSAHITSMIGESLGVDSIKLVEFSLLLPDETRCSKARMFLRCYHGYVKEIW